MSLYVSMYVFYVQGERGFVGPMGFSGRRGIIVCKSPSKVCR